MQGKHTGFEISEYLKNIFDKFSIEYSKIDKGFLENIQEMYSASSETDSDNEQKNISKNQDSIN